MLYVLVNEQKGTIHTRRISGRASCTVRLRDTLDSMRDSPFSGLGSKTLSCAPIDWISYHDAALVDEWTPELHAVSSTAGVFDNQPWIIVRPPLILWDQPNGSVQQSSSYNGPRMLHLSPCESHIGRVTWPRHVAH
jgi:hypothetical protein